jgi:hypothetical protein
MARPNASSNKSKRKCVTGRHKSFGLGDNSDRSSPTPPLSLHLSGDGHGIGLMTGNEFYGQAF